MNVLSIHLEDYSINNIYFLETKKNLILNGVFTKIIYTHDNFTLNGMYFDFPIQCQKIEEVNKSKYIVHFDKKTDINKELWKKIHNFEYGLLIHYKNFVKRDKKFALNILKQLNNENFHIYEKISKDSKLNFLLKISGIWETDNQYGITYKIVEAKNML